MVNTNSVLSSILFSQTIDWNIKQFFSSTSINSSFELKRIGKAITRRKDQMVVEDDKRYKRITIKTNCGGVFVRDEVLGKDNITTSFIPYKDGVTEGDFLIEDYFSWDDTIKAIVEDVIPDRKHPIKMLPNLPDKIKKELEKRINKFEADEFNGFIPLLDKIVELTKEQAV